MDDYEKFVDKFKPKLTTDDCYTPPAVYDAVADFAASEYNLSRDDFVRPFYPGGDYVNFAYKPSDIVVDNPPFSILAQICTFYNGQNIKYFLFAPTLTLFNNSNRCTCICTGGDITYHNGAKVNTSFLTNLDGDCLVRTAPKLAEAIRASQQKEDNAKLTYVYPDNTLVIAQMLELARAGVNYKIMRQDAVFCTQA